MKIVFHKNFPVKLSVFLAFLCFFAANPAFCNTIIKEDILNALEQKYSDKSFKADFTQVSKLAALDITEKASGTALFSHPGKMRWKYLTPQLHEIITNGASLWIYRPEEKQVMHGDASQFFQSGAGGAFLSDISLIRKNFTITVKEVTANYVEIVLIAKRETKDISSIIIRISQKNSAIERVVTYNPYDDTTLFQFSNIQFKNIDPEIFEFQIPGGVDIIEMD
ncbi:MAG: outer membrane lipoprotein carrier protein LolA [Deltaproteobacteria bacterium]|nr:outer membrane lipoprotein carrier protein LolA [Deltaproteobacteria bacterium]